MWTVCYEWGSLLLRWTHIVAGIAWIGSSFYFMHLDAAIKGIPEIPKTRAAKPGRCTAAAFIRCANISSRQSGCRIT